jgi:hypothetical protein
VIEIRSDATGTAQQARMGFRDESRQGCEARRMAKKDISSIFIFLVVPCFSAPFLTAGLSHTAVPPILYPLCSQRH